MPELPSGIKLAVTRDALFDHDGNWTECPDGHFWHLVPTPEMGPLPYDLINEIEFSIKHSPVPTSREEVRHFIWVVEINDNGGYSWRGEWLSSFPRYIERDKQDLAAWNVWINSSEASKFLDDTITECQRLAEISRHAQGFAVFEETGEPEKKAGLKSILKYRQKQTSPLQTIQYCGTRSSTNARLDSR